MFATQRAQIYLMGYASILLFWLGGISVAAEVDFSQPLTVEQCLQIALDNSPQMAIAKRELRRANLNVADAKAAYWPKVYLNGGYSLSDVFSRLEWTDNRYSASTALTERLYDNGRSAAEVRKSQANLFWQKGSYSVVYSRLKASVAQNYYQLLLTAEMMEVRKESLKQKEKDLELAEARFNLGLAPRADVLKAKASLSTAELSLVQAENNLQLAQIDLNNIMGIGLDTPVKAAASPAEEAEIPDVEGCLVLALARRPELVQANASVTISEISRQLAQRQRLPSLLLQGSYNIDLDRFAHKGVGLNGETWRRNTDWRAELLLSFPLFDAGLSKRAEQKAVLELENAKTNLIDGERGIELDVRRAFLNLVAARKKTEVAGRQMESAQESYDTAVGRYKAGVAPITEVIEAGVLLTEGKVSKTQAFCEYLIAKTELDLAMGK